jgi:hypothetical protein
MKSTSRRLANAAALLALAASLSACVMVPTRHGYVAVAPPAPHVEVVGVAPGPGYFWIDGYWGWHGNRHAWVGGHWEKRRPGYRWEPHAWQRDGGRYRESPGRWQPQ